MTRHVFGARWFVSRTTDLPAIPTGERDSIRLAGLSVYGNQGISVADIDNDGAMRFTCASQEACPNRLYKVRADGTAEDITARSGLGVLDETTALCLRTFAIPERQDAWCCGRRVRCYFVNRGDWHRSWSSRVRSKFNSTTPQGSFTGMAAADFDRDGRPGSLSLLATSTTERGPISVSCAPIRMRAMACQNLSVPQPRDANRLKMSPPRPA